MPCAAAAWLFSAGLAGCAALETTSALAEVDGGGSAPDAAAPPPAKPPRKPVPGANADDACDGVDAWGTCVGLELRRCDAGRLVRTPCVAPTGACAWVDDRTGFACVAEPVDDGGAGPPGGEAPEAPAPEACGEVDYLGACDGDVALYCHRGRLSRVECATWGQFCRFIDTTTGYYCTPDASLPSEPPADEAPDAPPAPPPPDDEPDAPPPPDDEPEAPPPPDDEPNGPPNAPPDAGAAPPPPDEETAPPPPEPESAPAPPAGPEAPDPPMGPDDCATLGYRGRCDGDVAVWCEGGQVVRRDCRAVDGLGCGWVDDTIGWYCGGTPR